MNRVWKVSSLGRSAAVVWVVLLTVYAVVVGGPATGTVVLVIGAVLAWRAAFWPALILTANDVTVRNPWGTSQVPLRDVAGAGGGYAGLSIQRRSGGTVTAWAVQKSNAAKKSGRTTRADEVTAAIMAAALVAP